MPFHLKAIVQNRASDIRLLTLTTVDAMKTISIDHMWCRVTVRNNEQRLVSHVILQITLADRFQFFLAFYHQLTFNVHFSS